MGEILIALALICKHDNIQATRNCLFQYSQCIQRTNAQAQKYSWIVRLQYPESYRARECLLAYDAISGIMTTLEESKEASK